MKNKLVSVIVPCYQQGEYLSDALASVLNQSYQHWECIIVNDGSTDDTEKIAHEWVEKDARFQYYYKENSGLADTRNFAISKSDGEYILPLDADDKIGMDYLKDGVEVLENYEYSVVYCEAEYFGQKKGKLYLEDFLEYNILKNNIVFCSAIFKRIDFDKTVGYNKNMIYGMEDWDLWISFLKIGAKFYKLPKVHFYYRFKEESMTVSMFKYKDKFNLMYDQIFMNHQEFFIQKLGNPIFNKFELDKVKIELDSIKKSYTFKIGNIILWLPKKIYDGILKLKQIFFLF